jgi:hypothetical protein
VGRPASHFAGQSSARQLASAESGPRAKQGRGMKNQVVGTKAGWLWEQKTQEGKRKWRETPVLVNFPSL